MNDTLASAPLGAAWPGAAAGPVDSSRRHYGLAALPSIMAAWDERIRMRWRLEQMAKDDPHLIDDIGLTRRQVEAEVAKPFWQG